MTRTDALTLPADELARRAMGGLSAVVVEVERPTFSGVLGTNYPLGGLTFAAKPESSGNRGLCEARVFSVSFEPVRDGWRNGTRDTPVRPSDIHAWSAFKVVDDTGRSGDEWSDAYERRLTALCEKAGRVLRTEDGDLGQVRFFSVEGPRQNGNSNNAWIGAHALQRAIESAKMRQDPTPACVQQRTKAGPDDCSDAVAVVASLSLGALLRVVVEECESRPSFCVMGEFLRSADGNELSMWRVAVEIENTAKPLAHPKLGRIQKIEVTSVNIIFD